jgi:hypothetical protein
MSIFWLIAAFGSGAFATAIGGVESFCITGVFAIIGTCIALAGGDGGMITGNIAFGMFGPHIAFAGAVAGAAYAKKAGKLENGADIVTPISSCNDPMALIVGGVFGVIGYLFKAFVVDKLFAGTISPKLVTDGPGFTVFCSAILVRLVFGGSLKTGQAIKSEGAAWTNVLTMGLTYSLMTAGTLVGLIELFPDAKDAILGNFAVTCFGIAAIGLIFACGGLAFYGCHQILLISALAASKAYPSMGAGGAIVAGVIFGVIAAIINDSETVFMNSGDVSHIDGPATAIFITTFIINAIWG